MTSKEWAAKVARAANDPERIERRKGIAPAFTVPRSRHEDACIWELAETPCPECAARIQECADQDDSNFSDRTVTYLSAEALAEMEASETKVHESHAIKAKELRAKFLRQHTLVIECDALRCAEACCGGEGCLG